MLDGIPVLRSSRVDQQDHITGRTEVDGPTVEHLVELLERGRCLEALVEMLAFPPPIPFGLGDRPGLRLPFTRGPWPHLALAARRAEVAAMLEDLDALTAQDWMELAYRRSSNRITGELFAYFFARFGQPRHLATLSLLHALPTDPRPVLDLACGYGHVMHHLASRDRSTDVVGVDRNFFQLWVGRRYIAPGQTFVCSDEITSLPFHDDAFAAAVCGDAFHYFTDQQTVLDEMRRAAQADTVILDRIGNALLEPRDSDHERDPAGYLELLRGAPGRILSEDELIAGYLADFGPQLAEEREPEEVEMHKWLSIVSSLDVSIFTDHQQLEGVLPPHAAGTLTISPLFTVREDGDEVCLSFSFPSTWYAFENSGMLSYTSAGERLTRDGYARLLAGDPDELEDYVRRFVVLGMPTRYAREPGSSRGPVSVAAGLARGISHRLLSHRRSR
ncbi:class I SAM-dependent methyltransferase [Actinomycetospora soli]|uniref:class I SAM-dependent methyltransferase n=1 Tax=Actinomycetospora soli TaxID=2893887 RepID=UPI001E57CE59|nr:class I SAM-dependent methyltransferase [Actinomycetospora soli]MCD2191734.1 class I SAM-dependent methyltransferase [Actinomycetospora soli]